MFSETFASFRTSEAMLSDRERAGRIVGALSVFLGLDQLLLWGFLGVAPGWIYAIGAVVIAGVAAILARTPSGGNRSRLGFTFLTISVSIAAILFLLGGEGRFFYATTDWQVRGAVLRDLALYPWPYVYDVPLGHFLLRAPLGMYLAPAAIGKLAGVSFAELALLAQNTLLLTTLMALGALLFPDRRQRWLALGIFLGFSGLDALGQILAGQPLWMNAERWDVLIFSAHVTQAFWATPHALAGWIGAMLYLLWRDDKLPLATFLAPLPMLALWSPLSLLGMLPFAAHAGLETLARRKLSASDIILPALTTLIALPSLLYLGSGSDAVGAGASMVPLHQYLAFEVVEVGPYLVALWSIGRSNRFGGATLAVVTFVLLTIPLAQVGKSSDFVMRASIPALVILALTIADILTSPARPNSGFWRRVLVISLAIGMVTPAFEIWRALTLPRAPAILCSYFGVVPGGATTYVTPLDKVSEAVRPRNPVLIRPHDPAQCWAGPWPEPLL